VVRRFKVGRVPRALVADRGTGAMRVLRMPDEALRAASEDTREVIPVKAGPA
jgi:hypothetical protein